MVATVRTIGISPINLLINGGMDFWQRGTSINNATSSKKYTADRWSTFTNSSSPTPSFTVSQQTDVPMGFRYSLKAQRTVGNTNVSGGFLWQMIESANITPNQGKVMTFSFWAKAGTNYSPTSSILNIDVRTGTGFDEDGIAAPYTGLQTIVNGSPVTLTTSWQRFSVSFTIPTTANEMLVGVHATHTGTAGADDSFYVTGMMVNEGGLPGSFYRAAPNVGAELSLCQRYYEKSFDTSQAPTTGPTNTSFVTNEGLAAFIAFGDVSQGISISKDFKFRVEKRAPPTLQLFGSANNNIYTTNGTTDSWQLSAVSIPLAGTAGFTATQIATGGTVLVAFHWTVDAEL